MKTDYIEPAALPVVRPVPTRSRMVPRQGGAVLFHYLSDGTVTATRDGVTGIGPGEAEALTDLARQARAQRPAPDATRR